MGPGIRGLDLVEARKARQLRLEREAEEAEAIEVKPDPQSGVWMPSRNRFGDGILGVGVATSKEILQDPFFRSSASRR
jgi:hypothetical protein